MIDEADDVPLDAAPAHNAKSSDAAGSGSGSGSMGVNVGGGSVVIAAEWEAVRRRCRTADSAVYARLSAFSKVAAQLVRVHQSQPPSAAVAGGSGVRSERAEKQQTAFVTADTRALTEQAAAIEADIHTLLATLNESVEAMARFVERNATGSGAAAAESTLQRYQSVSYDHAQDFKRTRENITALSARSQLLADATAQASGSAAGAGSRSKTDLLLREKGSLQSSLNMADEVIGAAMSASAGLDRQRTAFHSIASKLGSVGAAFPRINALITKVQRHKQRDTIILAAVVASCMCFTLFYIAYK